ncbi:hypothetical protein E2C01_038287 [Portunus trituberculatus]|uniref:Uncharacterized protein n=1 Tax=Portunus trituberculatus TaxID=210409 RepID=A0A5B7FAG2_PORTR|nr:hypothetical protein [Portunus trituberculatus]
MEHERSTSQLLLLVMYQITAHDDSQKGTEKPTWPPPCTPSLRQCNSRLNCVAAKGVLGRLVTCSPCCPQCLPKSAEGGAVLHRVDETEVLVARQARCFRQQEVMAVWASGERQPPSPPTLCGGGWCHTDLVVVTSDCCSLYHKTAVVGQAGTTAPQAGKSAGHRSAVGAGFQWGKALVQVPSTQSERRWPGRGSRVPTPVLTVPLGASVLPASLALLCNVQFNIALLS